MIPHRTEQVAGVGEGQERQFQESCEQVDNALFVRPTGWQRQDHPDGSVILVPHGLTPRDAFVMINWGRGRGTATLLEYLGASWVEMLEANAAKVVPGVKIQTWRTNGCQVVSTVEVFQPAVVQQVHTISDVAVPGERIEGIAFVASSQLLYDRYAGTVATMLRGMRFDETQAV
jgi:hypothetical protein